LLDALNNIEHELGEVRRKIEEHEGNCDGGDGHHEGGDEEPHEEGGDEATHEEDTTTATPRLRCHLDEYKNEEGGECLPCDGGPEPGTPEGCSACSAHEGAGLYCW